MSAGARPPLFSKQRLLAIARSARVLPLVERAYARRRVKQWEEANADYASEHPEAVFPPAELIQRTYGSPSFRGFREWGKANADDIAAAIERHKPTDAPKVAEWGCGLGRIGVHLLGRYDYTGFDIDESSIGWCREHLDARFELNRPDPPLPAEDESFDVVFAVSIFTHLSKAAHEAWSREMLRILKPGGIFVFTVHGEAQTAGLLPEERKRFDEGRLVVRGGVEEGSRTYLAYHPESFVQSVVLDGYETLEGPALACGQTLYVGRKAAG